MRIHGGVQRQAQDCPGVKPPLQVIWKIELRQRISAVEIFTQAVQYLSGA
jgi:hypothetical protein